MRTYQSLLSRFRKLGWTIRFNKETLIAEVITPYGPRRMKVTGPLNLRKPTSNKGWSKVDEKGTAAFIGYIEKCYRSKFPKYNGNKSNMSRKRIQARKQAKQVNGPIV